MASFARSVRIFPCSRALFAPRVVLPEHTSTITSRLFTTSLRFRAAAAAKSPAKNARSIPSTVSKTSPSHPTASATPSRYAFIKGLGTKGTPTLLYEGPSHFWFYFGCWSSGLSIIAWTVLTGPTVVQQPEGVSQWVGVVFGASYMMLAAMGFYLISKTPNIVSMIRVLPPTPIVGKAIGPGATAALPQIEITIKRMVPLLEPKVITTSLDNVMLKTRFSLPTEYVPELKRLQLKQAEEVRQTALRKFDMEHLLTMPFRRIGRALANLFRGVRAAWTDLGYGIIKVDGKDYKVDITKGFAHDGFLTLERIVSIGWK